MFNWKASIIMTIFFTTKYNKITWLYYSLNLQYLIDVQRALKWKLFLHKQKKKYTKRKGILTKCIHVCALPAAAEVTVPGFWW